MSAIAAALLAIAVELRVRNDIETTKLAWSVPLTIDESTELARRLDERRVSPE